MVGNTFFIYKTKKAPFSKKAGKNSVKNMDQDCDIDERVLEIDKELREIDEKISILSCRSRRLKQEKEHLKNVQIQKKTEQLSSRDWGSEDFPWSDSVRQVLKETFKLPSFRAQQLETINAILSKHDVLLLAPTGYYIFIFYYSNVILLIQGQF
jgi:superfamily II DNA/RNA helicase